MTMEMFFFLFRQVLHMLLLMGRQVHGGETRSGWQVDGEGYQAHIWFETAGLLTTLHRGAFLFGRLENDVEVRFLCLSVLVLVPLLMCMIHNFRFKSPSSMDMNEIFCLSLQCAFYSQFQRIAYSVLLIMTSDLKKGYVLIYPLDGL